MRIGVDLGGTKIEAAAFDGPRILARQRIPTPAGDYMATLMAVAGLVETLEAELGRRGSVGVGTPGVESAQSGLDGKLLAGDKDLPAIAPPPGD